MKTRKKIGFKKKMDFLERSKNVKSYLKNYVIEYYMN